ncbi:MAG: IclR family transcriptional regulator [Spirochaetota bacterium]
MKANEIRLIDCIIVRPGLNLRELVRQSEIPQTTVHRTLRSLCREKLLLRREDRYYLGPVLLRWINMVGGADRYVAVIRPYLRELAQVTGETVHLVQRDGLEAVYIDKVEGRGPISLKSKIGSKLQLYCTGAGRALLTLFTAAELQEYWHCVERVATTPHSQTDAEVLEQQIAVFRRQGYAVEVEQDQASIQCLGAAIDLGRVQLALSITTTILCDSQEFLQFAGFLREIVERIRAEFQLAGA